MKLYQVIIKNIMKECMEIDKNRINNFFNLETIVN